MDVLVKEGLKFFYLPVVGNTPDAGGQIQAVLQADIGSQIADLLVQPAVVTVHHHQHIKVRIRGVLAPGLRAEQQGRLDEPVEPLFEQLHELH
jgi:hypothetical protein